ncbi:MAG: hypothetical protein AzoDbin1_03596 [Azoarcus sp.]|nr:hypothetical protein [Azoarcus sp.]
MTGHSDNVTAHSDNQSKSVTIKSESAVTIAEPPVTLFRNQRSRCVGIRSLMVPLPQIVQWYAMLKRRQPQHVNRYIPRLIELGILESATLVHQDFMIHDRGIHIGDLKGEEFSAYVRFWDKLMDARAKEERPVTELDNSSTLQ